MTPAARSASAAKRRADDQDGQEVGARRCHRADRVANVVEHRVLEQQVLDRVAAQAELGEDRDGDAVVVAGVGLPQDRLGVGRRIGDRDRNRAGGDAGEALLVERAEVHAQRVLPGCAARGSRGPFGGKRLPTALG
jgi:hypothetical protein